MMHGKYAKLVKNFILFGFSSVSVHLISFIMVPLYTKCLTTAEYGIVDLLNTIIQLLFPILSLGIDEAVIRFIVNKDMNNNEVMTVSIKIFSISTIVSLLMLCILGFLLSESISRMYLGYIVTCVILNQLYQITNNFLRGIDHIWPVVIAATISSLTRCLMNVVLLLVCQWGMRGYITANVFAIIIPVCYLIMYIYRHKKFKIARINKALEKQMLKFSTPTILNGISWWINNSLDRFFVTSLCGTSANGIYATAYKIPSILNIIQTVFSQAWAFSAFKEFEEKDGNQFFSNIYCIYSAVTIIGCSFIMLFNIPLSHILYNGDFFIAWRYTGVLLLASCFGALSMILSPILSASNDTKALAFSTTLGAVMNTILNYLLISVIGIMGAGIATLCSNIAIWIYRLIIIKKYMKLNLKLTKNIFSYVLVAMQIIIGLYGYWYLELFCMILIVLLYKIEIVHLVKFILNSSKFANWKNDN